ncbi:disintegrin and metalloproteinase domain-containing protein 1-like [Rhinatrema bivittatum]|uniref:disintegrin and metalloproteinase domain-containing protein 1-like n=1 Tax=Rhinatrema bivittatum TaxID=194408 RepID=UPI00112BFF8F|nr:disintegrin and metalloproteinase domain-containing protein 1-like [Rhinatrema bivittatum]
MKTPDIGMRADGAKCGDKKICVDKECVSEATLNYDCNVTSKCNGKGVCNNMKNCHCNKEWAPPDCVNPGYGGSLDSGPLVNGSFISYVYPPEKEEEEEEEEEEKEKEKEEDNGASTKYGKVLQILAIVFGIGIPAIVAFIFVFMKISEYQFLNHFILRKQLKDILAFTQNKYAFSLQK